MDSLAIACVMFVVGYIIFRMSNSEKDQVLSRLFSPSSLLFLSLASAV